MVAQAEAVSKMHKIKDVCFYPHSNHLLLNMQTTFWGLWFLRFQIKFGENKDGKEKKV